MPINPYESDDCNIKLAIIGGEYLLVANKIIVDQDKTSKTVGRIDRVDVDLGHERTCRVYRSSEEAQCLSQSSNFHAFVFDVSFDIK